MDVVYVLVIRSEDTPNNMARVSLVAGTIAAAACAAVAGSLLDSAGFRLVLFAAAATALIVWGLLAIFSIGLPLAAAGILCLFATRDAVLEAGPDAKRTAVVATVAVVAFTIFAIAATG